VSTPLQSSGRSKSSFSQSTEICSSRLANGELTQLNATWSSALVSQSAPRAAGVPPPITKWKNPGRTGCLCLGRVDQRTKGREGAIPIVRQRASELADRSGRPRWPHSSAVDFPEISRCLLDDELERRRDCIAIENWIRHAFSILEVVSEWARAGRPVSSDGRADEPRA
jgi:hypothetical protein